MAQIRYHAELQPRSLHRAERAPMEPRSNFIQRLGQLVVRVLGAPFSLALLGIFAFFMIAQCVGDAKGALAWLGLSGDEGEAPEVRYLEGSKHDDARVARSLSRMLLAAGPDPDQFGVAVVVSPEFNRPVSSQAARLLRAGLKA